MEKKKPPYLKQDVQAKIGELQEKLSTDSTLFVPDTLPAQKILSTRLPTHEIADDTGAATI